MATAAALALAFVAATASASAGSRAPSLGHRVGTLAHAVCPPSPNSTVVELCLHTAILYLTTHDSLDSVLTDQWAVMRKQPSDSGRGLRSSILKRRRRAAQVGEFIGATSYTPRIVFLAGLMLRSLQKSTKLQEVFDPSLGYAAGATLGAWFCRREWLSCILLGWGAGGAYWSLFRVGPPSS